MKRTYIQDPVTLELIPKEEYQSRAPVGPYIMPDIRPYKSMVDGSMITSRSHHREHLIRNNVVEVGNSFDKATPKPAYTPGMLKEKLIRAANERLR